MNVVSFMRYLKGFVTFGGEGGFTERFINLSANKGIYIWDISFSENSLCGKCAAKDYRRLREVAKKSGVTLSLQEEKGLYFDIRERKGRSGLLFGAVFFITFYLVTSNFVWSIDVTGNEKIPKEDILLKAQSYGLYEGTFKGSFDEVAAAYSLSGESDGELSWAAINIKGSRAVIEVREQKESIKDTSEKAPCNIVADFDGVIISSEILNGTPNITEGDGVRKGDLLINGAEINEDMSVSFIEARGRITAKREKSHNISYSPMTKVTKLSEIKRSYTLNLFGIRIPISPFLSEGDGFFTEKMSFSYNGVTLPVSLTIKTSYKEEKALREERFSFLSFLEDFSESAYRLNSNTLILSENPKITRTDERIIIKNNWICLDFIGEKQKIILESRNY